ncbi:MAG: hypothetical protein II943_03600 [Victivallales bacterium]|nr:hypothetical protein [Victivallales bacterium]
MSEMNESFFPEAKEAWAITSEHLLEGKFRKVLREHIRNRIVDAAKAGQDSACICVTYDSVAPVVRSLCDPAMHFGGLPTDVYRGILNEIKGELTMAGYYAKIDNIPYISGGPLGVIRSFLEIGWKPNAQAAGLDADASANPIEIVLTEKNLTAKN